MSSPQHSQADPAAAQLIIEVLDQRLGSLGWIVIDRFVSGSATGGVRMVSDVTPRELALIARTMTYKYALLNIGMGGAKGGITRTPAELGVSRRELLERFGRAIAPLIRSNVYQPACDLGVDTNDFTDMMRGAGCAPALPSIDTADGTAITGLACISAIAAHRRAPLNGLRVALEGFGRVGGQLAKYLVDAGARLMSVSTADGALVSMAPLDLDRLFRLRSEYGSALVRHYPGVSAAPHSALFASDVDVLIPGARTESVHSGNADTIGARWVVPVGNAAVSSEAEQALTARGVLVIPDFLANCGGVLSVDLVSQGFEVADVRTMVREVHGPLIEQLLRAAERLGRPVGEVARELAWRNHAEMTTQPSVEPPSPLSRLCAAVSADGVSGVWSRLAWRVHKTGWTSVSTVRHPALMRSAEWRLGATARRLATLSR